MMMTTDFALRPPLARTSSTTKTTRHPPHDVQTSNNKAGSAANTDDKEDFNDQPPQQRQRQLSRWSVHQHHSPSFFHDLLIRLYLACDVLRVSCETRFTALVLLHRYAQNYRGGTDKNCGEKYHDNDHDNKDHWRWVAGACLFQACKAEEEHRRLRDIINAVHTVIQINNTNNTTVNNNDNNEKKCIVLSIDMTPPPLDDVYWASKRRLINEEQHVLRWLGFDVLVSHPHRAVLWIIDDQQQQPQEPLNHDSSISDKKISLDNNTSHNTEFKSKKVDDMDKNTDSEQVPTQNHQLSIMAFRRLNDGLFSVRALQHPTMVLACAALDLALTDDTKGVASTTSPSNNGTLVAALKTTANTNTNYDNHNTDAFQSRWWERYHVSTESLQSCKQDLMNVSLSSSSW
mmetsp:Transcript_53019/g.128635  ORF Transcript_53019/g.128635 Transcript_53019/m.128635 type:complete len:402 (+) Transcript_53019:95-1300(+)